MQIVKGILIVIYFIVCVATIILALIQSKEDAGLSSTITGTTTNNFFEKNKGNTKEGKQKKWIYYPYRVLRRNSTKKWEI